MKAKVIKTYIDKYTNVLHNEDEEITITKERVEEINSTFPDVIFVKEIKKPTKKVGD